MMVLPFNFPVVFSVGPWHLPAHFVFDLLAYSVGFHLYRLTRSPSFLTARQAALVLVGAVIGGLLGARLVLAYAAGKSIVGGILGGTLGVELAKKAARVTERTGDEVTFPLLLGLAIGRVGCFLAGLTDQTHGVPTDLPWGIDFGDGVLRHPVQLYEIAFLGILALALVLRKRRPWRQGDLYRGAVVAYLSFRFFVDFLKPFPLAFAFGLTGIQVACAFGVAFYAKGALRLLGRRLVKLVAWQSGIVGVAVASWGCVGWLSAVVLNSTLERSDLWLVEFDLTKPGETGLEVFKTARSRLGTDNALPDGVAIKLDGTPLAPVGKRLGATTSRKPRHTVTFEPGFGAAYVLPVRLPLPLSAVSFKKSKKNHSGSSDYLLTYTTKPGTGERDLSYDVFIRDGDEESPAFARELGARTRGGAGFLIPVAPGQVICVAANPFIRDHDHATHFGVFLRVRVILWCGKPET